MKIPIYLKHYYGKPILLLTIYTLISFKAFSQSETKLSLINQPDSISNKLFINNKFHQAFIQNTKPSFFGWEFGDPTKSLLSADVLSNFIVLNSPKVRALLLFTTRVKVRMFDEASTPIKSPSFMPGATLFIRKNANVNYPEFFSLSYAHHSNGQRGPALNQDGTFNRDSGNFTTNFYSLNYHYGKSSAINNLIRNRYTALGFEVHSGLFDKGYEKKLKNKYGFLRLNGNWNYVILRSKENPTETDSQYNNWQRIQLEFSYIVDQYNGYSINNLNKRLNLTGKYYYHFPFMDNVAMMISAGYKGQDDYNIYFEDSYPFITLGLTAHTSFSIWKKQP